MKSWYLSKMLEAHHNKQWVDRLNYSKAAGVDFVREIYLNVDDSGLSGV